MILKLIAGLVLSVTTFAAAFQYGGIKHDITSQTSSISTIILNSASTQVQRITGSTAQVLKLPDATTLRAGYWYTVVNESSAAVTISNSSSTSLGSIAAATPGAPSYATLYLTSNSTSGGPWTFQKDQSGSGSGSFSGRFEQTTVGGTTVNNNCDGSNCALFDNTSGITAVTYVAGGRFNLTLTSTSCLKPWVCHATSWDATNSRPVVCGFDANSGSPSTTLFTFQCRELGNTQSNANHKIDCFCQI